MTQPHWQPGSARPRLREGAVDVWLVALDRAADPAPLDDEERARAGRFVRPDDGTRWARARAALRGVLAAYADAEPAALRFVAGPHGKPALAGDDALRFNLSHSGETALIAVARGREVGVDVELPRRAVDHVAIARRVLAPAEAERIAALADPAARERAFLAAWVRWEAVLKCRGTGIGGEEEPSDRPEPWVTELPIAPPAAAALAVEGGQAALRTFRWEPGAA